MKLRLYLSLLTFFMISYLYNVAFSGKLQSLFGSFSKNKKLLGFEP